MGQAQCELTHVPVPIRKHHIAATVGAMIYHRAFVEITVAIAELHRTIEPITYPKTGIGAAITKIIGPSTHLHATFEIAFKSTAIGENHHALPSRLAIHQSTFELTPVPQLNLADTIRIHKGIARGNDPSSVRCVIRSSKSIETHNHQSKHTQHPRTALNRLAGWHTLNQLNDAFETHTDFLACVKL